MERYDRSASASDRDGFSGDKAIFPEAAGEDLALYYGISGGIPAQILRMQGKSVKDAAEVIFAGNPGQAALLPEQVMGMELRSCPIIIAFYRRWRRA